MRFATVVLLLFLSFLFFLFTSCATLPTHEAWRVVVHANLPWQFAGITLKRGDHVLIWVEGGSKWQTGTEVVSANGHTTEVESSEDALLPGMPRMALVGMVDDYYHAFLVGERKEFISDNNGALYLAPNNVVLSDNYGRIWVNIEVVRAK